MVSATTNRTGYETLKSGKNISAQNADIKQEEEPVKSIALPAVEL